MKRIENSGAERQSKRNPVLTGGTVNAASQGSRLSSSAVPPVEVIGHGSLVTNRLRASNLTTEPEHLRLPRQHSESVRQSAATQLGCPLFADWPGVYELEHVDGIGGLSHAS